MISHLSCKSRTLHFIQHSWNEGTSTLHGFTQDDRLLSDLLLSVPGPIRLQCQVNRSSRSGLMMAMSKRNHARLQTVRLQVRIKPCRIAIDCTIGLRRSAVPRRYHGQWVSLDFAQIGHQSPLRSAPAIEHGHPAPACFLLLLLFY